MLRDPIHLKQGHVGAGRGRALEMVLLGNMIDAVDAMAIGLVNKVFPDEELMDSTRDVAKALATRSPLTLKAALKAVGLDISEAALEQARENRARSGLAGAVELRACGADPYSALLPAEDFDAIISNPPYVSEADLEGLAAEVRNHDPHVALAGGADGLEIVRTVAQGAHERLRPGGALFLEIGAEQGEAVRRILRSSAPWAVIDIRHDLAGRDRFAVARV